MNLLLIKIINIGGPKAQPKRPEVPPVQYPIDNQTVASRGGGPLIPAAQGRARFKSEQVVKVTIGTFGKASLLIPLGIVRDLLFPLQHFVSTFCSGI